MCLLFALGACDSSGNDDGDENGNGNGSGNSAPSTFTATINGVPYTLPATFYQPREDGAFSVAGVRNQTETEPSRAISLTIEGSAPGVYPVGEGLFSSVGSYTTGMGAGSGSVDIYTSTRRGDGSITVTGVSDDRVTGTFSFTAGLFTGRPGADSMAVITEGTFDVGF